MLIDTDRARQCLLEAEFTEQHAAGIVEVMRMLDEEARGALATKDDLQQQSTLLRTELQQQSTLLRTELQQQSAVFRAELEALEARMTRRIYAVAFVIVAALGTLNFFT